KPPGRFSLRLAVYPPPQVMQTNGRLCHFTLAFRVAGGSTKQQGPFARRTLLRVIARTDPSATLSSSTDFPGSPVIRPTLLRRFRGAGGGGLLQLLSASLSPCCRYHPAGVE